MTERRQERLRLLLTVVSMENRYLFQIDWISEPREEVVERHAKEAHIALIYAENQDEAIRTGKWILNSNVCCLIIFYGERAAGLKPYFSARPVAFMEHIEDHDKRIDAWTELIESTCAAVEAQPLCFRWESRKCSYFLPHDMILHIQSLRTTLQIASESGRIYEAPGKLDAAEQKIMEDTDRFMRVHQSFLVNLSKVRAWDKSQNMLLLSDGSMIPVSKRYLREVRRRLEMQNLI